MIQTQIDWVAPQDPRVTGDDAARASAQALKILELLRQGPQTNVELADKVSHRFGGRLHDLRAMGFEIDKERGKGGLFTYRLVKEPS